MMMSRFGVTNHKSQFGLVLSDRPNSQTDARFRIKDIASKQSLRRRESYQALFVSRKFAGKRSDPRYRENFPRSFPCSVDVVVALFALVRKERKRKFSQSISLSRSTGIFSPVKCPVYKECPKLRRKDTACFSGHALFASRKALGTMDLLLLFYCMLESARKVSFHILMP